MKQQEKSTREFRKSSLSSEAFQGKLPPQAIEMEEAVLGALLLEKDAFEKISDIITDPEAFYVDAHEYIFQAIQALKTRSEPADLLTVASELSKNGKLELVGGPYFLVKLSHSVVSSAHIVAHAMVIAEKFLARKVIKTAQEMIVRSYDVGADIFDIIEFSEKEILTLSQSSASKEPMRLEILSKMVKDEVLHKLDNKIENSGILSGFSFLDKITKGWQNTDLIILGARPATGKTAISLNFAVNAARLGNKVAFFSLEMGQSQLVKRILASETEVPLELINTPTRMSDIQKTGFFSIESELMPKLPLYIGDYSSLTVMQLKSKCRRLKSKVGLELVIIDYLQLMRGERLYGGNREQEISQISRELKGLAKELGIPVIALCQLSRKLEERAIKEPVLADLRESGAIEQDADIVMLMYPPSPAEIDADPRLKYANYINIAKHRNGGLDKFPIFKDLSIQKFYNEPPPAKFEASGDFISNKAISTYHSRNEEEDLPF